MINRLFRYLTILLIIISYVSHSMAQNNNFNKIDLSKYNRLPLKKINDLFYNTGSFINQADSIKRINTNLKIDSAGLKEKISGLTDLKSIDELADQKISSTHIGKAIQDMKTSTGQIDDMKETLSSMDLRKIRESVKNERLMKSGMKEILSNYADLTGDYKEIISTAQEMLSKLKNKYSSLPSSDNLSEGIRRNSLKNVPPVKRFIIGGHVELRKVKPFSADLSPVIAFRIRKNFRMGLSGTYRIDINDSVLLNSGSSVIIFGIGLFGEPRLLKSYFGHLEWERTNTFVRTTDITTIKKREYGLLIGLGKEFPIKGGLKGMIMLLYDTLHRNTINSPRSWQVKTGIFFKQK